MKMTVMEKAVKCWWLAEIVSFFYFCLFKKLFSQIDHRETYFIYLNPTVVHHGI
jgi:hypothetical protein